MATLAAASNHNFTATAWGTVDATALLVSNTNNTGITSTYQLSSTFTPGAITVDGIAIWINTRAASPSGTISVALDQATVTVTGTEVTINISDIPADGNCWVFFKFAAPVLLVAATAYSVKIKTSAASGQANCFRNNAGGTNWSRLLRTTTLAAPGAGDNLYILGEKTGAGTGNTITVTMENTASTIFGQIDVSAGGILTWSTGGSLTLLLKIAGNLNIRSGGEYYMGTPGGTPIASSSTAELFFSNSSNVDFGIEIIGNGIFKSDHADSITPWALLAADAIATATSLTADRSTGWKNGDSIGIASTSRNAGGEAEAKALTADASGTSLTITALTNAHGGSASTLVQAELINLTRKIKIHGASTSAGAYINTSTTSVVDLNKTEVYFMGSGTSNKRGVDIKTTTGSFHANYCSFRDFASSCAMLAASGTDHIRLEHTVTFNNNATTGFPGLQNATTGTDIIVNDCVFIRSNSSFTSGEGVRLCYNHTVTDLRVSSCNIGGIVISGGTFNGSFTNLTSHSNGSANGGSGIIFGSLTVGTSTTITNLVAWRNMATGNSASVEFAGTLSKLIIDGLTAFGNLTRNISINNNPFGLIVLNATVRAGVTLTAGIGMEINVDAYGVIFVNSTFGGSGQTHSTGDIQVNNAGTNLFGWLLDNCALSSTVQIVNQTNMGDGGTFPIAVSGIRSNFLGQTQNHKTWMGNGTWSYDTTAGMFVVSPSLRMTPSSASVKLQSPGFLVGVLSGQSVTASIKVRKSVIGDGAAYNGAQPRWYIRRNYGAGITSDTLLDTATAAADGAFETLTGVTAAVSGNCTLEFYVDCDGTAGWVNCDDVSLVAA